MSGSSTDGKFPSMVEVRLSAVQVDVRSSTPVVLLTETAAPERTLAIFIGPQEAQAIAFALQGTETPRPMTHDLLRDVVEGLGARLERVVITELRLNETGQGTYHAELHLRLGRELHRVSSRPSDAVALAVRTGSPLFVADDLMDAEGILLSIEASDDDEDEESSDELVGQ